MSAFEGRNEPVESELEACIDYAANVVNVDAARTELSALRSRVAELEAQNAQQAAQLEQAYQLLTDLDWNDYDERAETWVTTYQQQHAKAESH